MGAGSGTESRGDAAGEGRSASELATLLLELSRLVKARRFYPPGDARLVPLFERGLRAWSSDLSRRGDLDLEIRERGFGEHRGRGTLSHAKLADLQREFRSRRVSRLCVSAQADAEAFAALVEVLATDPEALEAQGGFARALYARAPSGFVVNGCPGEPADGEDTLEFLEEGLPTMEDGEPAAGPQPTGSAPPAAAAGEAVESEIVATADASANPLELQAAPVGPDAESRALPEVLAELEACEQTSKYVELARQVARLADRATEHGETDEAYAVLLQLAGHVHGKRDPRQREMARSFLRSLTVGPRLEDVIRRASDRSDRESIQATQLLIELGDDAVRCLLRAAAQEPDPDRRARMHGVLIAMGEKILPELLRLMEGDDPEKAKLAARLVGETQNPDGVPQLSRLLSHPDPGVREEAAKALVRVGTDRATDMLIRALRSRTPGLVALAIHCLGVTGQVRAVGPLVQALRAAVEERQVERARDVIRALGRLGRREATQPLADLLQRKSLLGRRWLRDLKVMAATALGGLPGDEAVGALAQAARSRDPQLRRAAQTALDRRAQALASSSSP